MTFSNKFNRGLGCGFLLSVLLFLGCQTEIKLIDLQTETYAISGLQIGMLVTDVIERLGKPNQIKDITTAGHYPELVYERMNVFLSKGPNLNSPNVVSAIYSRDANHCFNDVICPGDALQSIMEKLGETEVLPAEYGKPARLYYILPNLETCWFEAFTEDLSISSEISIACQP